MYTFVLCGVGGRVVGWDGGSTLVRELDFFVGNLSLEVVSLYSDVCVVLRDCFFGFL